jgi:hypothetical protein
MEVIIMADSILKMLNGEVVNEQVTVVSTGATSAGKTIGLDPKGKLDTSVLPDGIGLDSISVTASEALSAGDFVNLWDNAGTMSVRKADNSDSTKKADGFVKSAVASGSSAVVYLEGNNDKLTGLAVGTKYFLDGGANAGKCTSTAPSTANSIIQYLGFTKSTSTIRFEQNDYIKNI